MLDIRWEKVLAVIRCTLGLGSLEIQRSQWIDFLQIRPEPKQVDFNQMALSSWKILPMGYPYYSPYVKNVLPLSPSEDDIPKSLIKLKMHEC